ncbi:MAG TPA: serine/threonine protein kinase [Candidatus Hydrogenedentes bacterium]|nr:serine/threonine protein kinase [Candidatus Hydrogenedentota bacterium]
MDEAQYTPDRQELYGYKLDRILGRGGTATVYRGIDAKKGKVVAVKLFRASFFRNNLHIRDLAKCVKQFKRFEHCHLVRIYDFMSGKDGECLIMEYIDGPDLRWYIQNRPWNLRERLGILSQICTGFQYLHERGFVHHDFKPGNVLFTRKGVAKISDYSLAGKSYLLALFDPNGAHDQITPMYVAPELLRKEKASPQSDMYSLGITMYLMFTGRVPFEVDSLPKLLECHLRVIPEHPSVVDRRCPHDLGDIIMRLLDKRPQNRYEDCDQLRIALADIGRSRI